MSKVTLNDITSGYQSTAAYNENNEIIEDAFDNTLSLDGSTPNSMDADIDLNSNKLLNVGRIEATQLYLNGGLVTTTELIINSVGVEEHTATAGQTVFNLTSITYAPGVNGIQVFINGILQSLTTYEETDINTITFDDGVNEGDFVTFNIFSFI